MLLIHMPGWMRAMDWFYIKNIKDALIEKDPANSDFYTKNYDTYRKEIAELDKYISSAIKTIPEKKRILVNLA